MILASIKPYYYYLIGEGKKKIEVRKSALKNLPQDIVFYMSKDEKSFAKIPKEFQEKYRKHFGKVGLRVVCNKVEEAPTSFISPETVNMAISACIDVNKMCDYGKGKTLYGWHISDLKIYDKPKKVSEFFKRCPTKEKGDCLSCDCLADNDYGGVCTNNLTRPPQSYMWVEEL